MKKEHDDLIRQIYATTLESAALPARCYAYGFKNLQHLYDVANNEQNFYDKDFTRLTSNFLMMFKARTIKQHHVSQEFYNFVITKVSEIDHLLRNNGKLAYGKLLLTISDLVDKWGYDTTSRLMDEYRQQHPLPSEWYFESKTDEDKQKWEDYFAYQKSLRFGAFYKIRTFLESLEKQMAVLYGNR